MPFLKKRKEKRKYVARPGIEPRTPDLRVRCPTDCATRPGPVYATDEEICKKVQVYSDRRNEEEEIAQALGISHVSVSTILHDRLGMRKLSACWVPKTLSDEQMATRASVCSTLLKCFRSKDDFLLRLVTVD